MLLYFIMVFVLRESLDDVRRLLHSPCTKCKGHFLYTIGDDGRDRRFRVWRGLGTRDSLDEEWEKNLKDQPNSKANR
jgi:hypothetical protein